jgi:hypothetical protein
VETRSSHCCFSSKFTNACHAVCLCTSRPFSRTRMRHLLLHRNLMRPSFMFHYPGVICDDRCPNLNLAQAFLAQQLRAGEKRKRNDAKM